MNTIPPMHHYATCIEIALLKYELQFPVGV